MQQYMYQDNTQTTKQSTILAVDDVPANLTILTEILKNRYKLKIATNGRKALEIIDQSTPDLILLDIIMPGMDGFEVCRQIRTSEKCDEVPIIFLTARDEPEDVVSGFQLGAADYITKPFNAEELLVRVKAHLELKHNRDTIKQQAAAQRELIHVLCHDLANPVGSIMNVLEVLRMQPENFLEFQDLLDMAADNSIAIIKLVRQMSAVEEKPLQLEELNLADAVQDSLMMLKGRFTQKAIQVLPDVGPVVTVQAEPTSLVNSVINNLLTNAVKFSENGAIIKIHATSEPDVVTLSVTDQGIGMPPELLSHVFDIHKTANRPGTLGETGTGFGMPLIRKFMNAYKGDIRITSRAIEEFPDEHGTTVTLVFPGKQES